MDATEYTYEDAAKACGVSTETIRQRARRGKLSRGRPTNTGRPTVLLTGQDMAAISAGRTVDRSTSGQPDGWPDGQPSNALEGETGILHEALARERDRADRAEVQATESRALAEQRSGELTAALVRAATAEGEARALRDTLEEARRPAWRRWLGR